MEEEDGDRQRCFCLSHSACKWRLYGTRKGASHRSVWSAGHLIETEEPFVRLRNQRHAEGLYLRTAVFLGLFDNKKIKTVLRTQDVCYWRITESMYGLFLQCIAHKSLFTQSTNLTFFLFPSVPAPDVALRPCIRQAIHGHLLMGMREVLGSP